MVGFSAADAEPFAVGPASPSECAAIVRERLRVGGAVIGSSEPIWAGHRGHAIWLHPGALDASRMALALRVAEVTDPGRILATHTSRLVALAIEVVEDASDLEAALQDARLDELAVRLLGEGVEPEPRYDAGADREPEVNALILVDSRGDAIVARVAGSSHPLGILDRAGRPFVIPLAAPSIAGWLALVHQALDLDAPASAVLEVTEGARLDGDAPPELVARPGASLVVQESLASVEA